MLPQIWCCLRLLLIHCRCQVGPGLSAEPVRVSGGQVHLAGLLCFIEIVMSRVGLEFRLPNPYRLQETLRLLVMGSGDPSSQISETKAQLIYATDAGLAEVEAFVEGQRLLVNIEGPSAEQLAPRVEKLFGLHDEPARFQPEGPAAKLVQQLPGTHLPVTPFLFPKLIQIVLQQLVSWEDASAAWRSILRKYGERSLSGSDLIACPGASELLSLGYYDLVACGALPRQARLILQLARQQSRIERLAANDPVRLLKWLQGVPGVGIWTIGYVRGFAFGDPDVVIRGDYAIPDYVSWFLKKQPRSSDEEMAELLQPFSGHRFRFVHLLMQSGIKPPRRAPRAASNRWRNRR